MFSLPLAWTLLTVYLWTSGSCQILQQKPLTVRYPEISSAENIECDCVVSCDVYWYRTTSNHNKVQFLAKYNNADRLYPADKMKQEIEARFKLSKRGSSFILRIMNVSKEDTGIYSCVLMNRKHEETWTPGVLLLPGVTPPTVPPKKKPTKPKKPMKPTNTGCKCPKKSDCGSLVLWPLVGLIAGLTLAIICTLYYFSRLPKKCRHRLVKRR